jgi:hypothetical protein
MEEKCYYQRKAVFNTKGLTEYTLKLAPAFVPEQAMFSKYKRQIRTTLKYHYFLC